MTILLKNVLRKKIPPSEIQDTYEYIGNEVVFKASKFIQLFKLDQEYFIDQFDEGDWRLINFLERLEKIQKDRYISLKSKEKSIMKRRERYICSENQVWLDLQLDILREMRNLSEYIENNASSGIDANSKIYEYILKSPFIPVYDFYGNIDKFDFPKQEIQRNEDGIIDGGNLLVELNKNIKNQMDFSQWNTDFDVIKTKFNDSLGGIQKVIIEENKKLYHVREELKNCPDQLSSENGSVAIGILNVLDEINNFLI